jgi:hypothetical protein
MKRILDMDSFIKEAETAFIDSIENDSKIKIKHKKNKHDITIWIKESLSALIEKNSSSVIKKINLRTNKKLTKQEVYTLKKSSMDFITYNFFKKKNQDYFSNNFIIKLNSQNVPENFPIKIKNNQLIYFYMNFYPLALIKLSKNSSILDPVSGNSYMIEEYYQNSIRADFIAPLDKGNVSLEYPLFFGYIILNKEK